MSCTEFSNYEAKKSSDGLVAVMSENSEIKYSGDSTAVCVYKDIEKACNKRGALLYLYRPDKIDIIWIEPKTLLIKKTGGEVRKWCSDKSNTCQMEAGGVKFNVVLREN